jgi:CPA1 family monovalent cation:H+ antiporter
MSFLSSLLNAALFVLVGLEAVSAVENLGGAGLAHGLVVGLVVAAAVSAAVIGARFVWLFVPRPALRAVE